MAMTMQPAFSMSLRRRDCATAVPTAPALLVIATNTYNAYNNWGGKSLYTGGRRVSFRRPFGRGMIDRPAAERVAAAIDVALR